MNGLVELYVRDRTNGKVHRVGDDCHDHLCVDENGIVQYVNLKNGDGTLCGTTYEKKARYEFVKEVNEDDLRQG